MSIHDCIIIGGGIGGLTAAMYLARFRCNAIVIDNDDSRANLIPISHNFPTFVDGIAGKKIICLLRMQAEKYGAHIIQDTVIALSQTTDKTFKINTHQKNYFSRFVILATGVSDIEPNIPHVESAIKKGLIRHCLICDGYEVIDKKIGILANSKKGIREAVLLSNYSNEITLINIGPKIKLNALEKKIIQEKNIKLHNTKLVGVTIEKNQITIVKTELKEHVFDTIYSAFGAKVRTHLSINLGAKHLKDGCIHVDAHQETSIQGLYAIGDIIPGLNQMCVASSHGAIAATAIFNQLKNL